MGHRSNSLTVPSTLTRSKRLSPRCRFSLRDLCRKGFCSLTPLLLISAAWGQGMTQGIMSPPANVRPPYLTNVGIEQRLDGQVPPDLAFVDETGRPVKLGDYFGQKPLVLNLVYYN